MSSPLGAGRRDRAVAHHIRLLISILCVMLCFALNACERIDGFRGLVCDRGTRGRASVDTAASCKAGAHYHSLEMRTRAFPDRRGRLPYLGQASPVPLKLVSAAMNGFGTAFEVTLCAGRSSANLMLSPQGIVLPEFSLSSYSPQDILSGQVTMCSEIKEAAAFDAMPCVTLVFDCIVDTRKPWSLAIPSRSGFVRSSYGGFMAGVVGVDQSFDNAPHGSIFITPSDGLPAELSKFAWLTSGGPTAPDHWAFWFASADGSIEWSVDPGGLNFLNNGVAINCPAVPLLGGGIDVDLSGASTNTGDYIEWRPWNPGLVGDGGEFAAPFRFTF